MPNIIEPWLTARHPLTRLFAKKLIKAGFNPDYKIEPNDYGNMWAVFFPTSSVDEIIWHDNDKYWSEVLEVVFKYNPHRGLAQSSLVMTQKIIQHKKLRMKFADTQTRPGSLSIKNK